MSFEAVRIIGQLECNVFFIIGELEGGVFVDFASERFWIIGDLDGGLFVDF